MQINTIKELGISKAEIIDISRTSRNKRTHKTLL
jgi:hypothetical protein